MSRAPTWSAMSPEDGWRRGPAQATLDGLATNRVRADHGARDVMAEEKPSLATSEVLNSYQDQAGDLRFGHVGQVVIVASEFRCQTRLVRQAGPPIITLSEDQRGGGRLNRLGFITQRFQSVSGRNSVHRQTTFGLRIGCERVSGRRLHTRARRPPGQPSDGTGIRIGFGLVGPLQCVTGHRVHRHAWERRVADRHGRAVVHCN